MADHTPQDSWKSAVAGFLKYCEQPMPENDTITETISNLVSKIETETTAHIRPNVFLIDLSSNQPLRAKRKRVTVIKPSSAIAKEEAAREPLKLRSGRILAQENDNGVTEMVDLSMTESPVPRQLKWKGSQDVDDVDSSGADAESQNDGLDQGDNDDSLMGDASEVRELTDVAADGDASDQDGEILSDDSRQPENYLAIHGCPRPIPIWDYLGREFTQDIVDLLEVMPIQQPEYCQTELKHWQLSGIGKLLHLFGTRFKGGILGDEQGLGKSLTAITAMIADIVDNEGKPYRGFNLIVTSKSCAPQWIGEIKQHYGPEMAEKAFYLNDAKVTASDLLDGEYHFVVCTWHFVMSRYAAYQKNLKFFKLLATNGRKWLDENMVKSDMPSLTVRHINALFSPVYQELNLPIRHLVLDEAQFAKNVTTKTYDAVRHLQYERILLLSGTFLANRWHDLFGLVSLIPGHPFVTYQQFMKTFAHKEADGYYSTPSVSKRNRLIKFLMAFTISRPVSVLNLPSICREFHDFVLTADEEADVAQYVQKYLMLMSKASKQQVFHRRYSSTHKQKKAFLQAVLAQLSCANISLHVPAKKTVRDHLLAQTVRLKERFAAARIAAGGAITMKELLAMVTPTEMSSDQAVSLEVTEELYNVSLVQQQGETGEVEEDVPKVIIRGSQAHDPAQVKEAREEAARGEDDNDSLSPDEDSEVGGHLDYKHFKPGEERIVWLARLRAMEDRVLLSSKVTKITALMSQLRGGYPNERIVVFSRFLKFLDMLGEVIRRSSELSDMVPLQFNGTHTSEQRSFSQNSFNDLTNRRPIFITVGSCGAGLNLAGGSQIIQCEPWWNPTDEFQAQSRCWRMGQQRPVHVYVMRGTNSLIDYIMEQCQISKTTTTSEIMMPLRRKDDDVVTIPKQYQGGVGEHQVGSCNTLELLI